jgi:hypothetical protein
MSSRQSSRHSAHRAAGDTKTRLGRRVAGFAAAAVATVAALSGTLLSAPESQAAGDGNTVVLRRLRGRQPGPLQLPRR